MKNKLLLLLLSSVVLAQGAYVEPDPYSELLEIIRTSEANTDEELCEWFRDNAYFKSKIDLKSAEYKTFCKNLAGKIQQILNDRTLSLSPSKKTQLKKLIEFYQ